jgi:hypothetical protein
VLLNRIKRMRKLRRRKLVLLMLSCGVDVRTVRPWVLSSFFFLTFLLLSFLIIPLPRPHLIALLHTLSHSSGLIRIPISTLSTSLARRTSPEEANNRAPTLKKREQQQEQCPTPSFLHSRRIRGRLTKVSSRLSERSSRVSPLLCFWQIADSR